MTRIGYARVSSIGQTLDVQLDKLKHCDKIFREKISGVSDKRPQLQACLDYMREGDIFIVTRLDRLARSTLHLCQIAAELESKGIDLKVLDQNIDTGSANLLTEYQYDILGNHLVITNARTFTQSHTIYDTLNRPISVTDSLGNVTSYTYDALGNLRQMIDGNGEVTTYEYDNLNRPVTTSYTADNETVVITYDAAGNRRQMIDGVGTTTYDYDELYRLITVTNPITGTVGYEYDTVGNRTKLIYPDGKEVVYTYDGDYRLDYLTDWNLAVTDYGYDPIGRLITTTLPNGVVSVNTYDDTGRLLSLTHTGSGSVLLGAFDYQLDGTGNRQFVTETLRLPDTSYQVATIDYDYDALYRLTDATYTGDLTADFAYDYDEVGNMVAYTETVGAQTTSVTRIFNAANELVSSSDPVQGTSTYTYDSNGSLVTILDPLGDSVNYDYNQRRMLLQQTQTVSGITSTVAEFVYDGGNDRLQQITFASGSPVTTTTYHNDIIGLTQVLLSDSGTTQSVNLFGYDLIHSQTGGNPNYQLADGLGSVRLELDGATHVATQSYGPYGNVIYSSGPSGTVYGFTGEQQDVSTGLTYLRARYYSSDLRAFVSRDPWQGNMQRPSSLWKYQYVESNPILYYDPTGLWVWRHYSATINWEHSEVEKWYETEGGLVGGEYPNYGENKDRQVEYTPKFKFTIAGKNRGRIDLFNSAEGFIYEIEPFTKRAIDEGKLQVLQYENLLNAASRAGFLTQEHRNSVTQGNKNNSYDWNGMTFDVGDASDWPGLLETTYKKDPNYKFFADYESDGVIVYWIEPQNDIELKNATFIKPNHKQFAKEYNYHEVRKFEQAAKAPGIVESIATYGVKKLYDFCKTFRVASVGLGGGPDGDNLTK